MNINIDLVVQSFIGALLWTEHGSEEEDNFLDETFDHTDTQENDLVIIKKVCLKFVRDNKKLIDSLPKEYTQEQLGHDFLLTSNGHGVGFWDRGLGELGDKLKEACEEYHFYAFEQDEKLFIEQDGKTILK